MGASKRNIKQAVTIRIDSNIWNNYNNLLKTMYGEKQRKKGIVIEQLLQQLIKQDTDKLHKCLEDNEPIITTDYGSYETQTKKLATVTANVEVQKKQINKLTTELESEKEVREKNKQLTIENNKLSTELTTVREQYKELQNTIKRLNNMIETLQKEIETSHYDYKQVITESRNTSETLENKLSAKDNDYKHIVEVMNKVQREKSDLEKQIQTYSYVLGSIQSMSLMNRILKRYPEEIKELKPYTEED